MLRIFYNECRYAEFHYAECIMLNVVKYEVYP
jgi:hypothetical protein